MTAYGAVALSAVTTWWLLPAPLIVLSFLAGGRPVARAYSLVVAGYHAASVGARLRYEERSGLSIRHFELNLENTEPGHYELFVPAQEEWTRTVPDWAQNRRDEIASRIRKSWRRDDVHFPEEGADA
jgi:hypothetical protein